eukprot:TRINITY_DN6202_c0_g1_i1.p1 TRINITY_DN6202_c0_g1~~TRINITY_DN6202_c0_g1_i1.p1  ORF type:complete len:209 (-),score=37.37 TRINITY_DN6202_c0_g1_i1:196-822(-)
MGIWDTQKLLEYKNDSNLNQMFQTVTAMYKDFQDLQEELSSLQKNKGTVQQFRNIFEQADAKGLKIENAEQFKKGIKASELWEKEAKALLETKNKCSEYINKLHDMIDRYKSNLCGSITINILQEQLFQLSSSQQSPNRSGQGNSNQIYQDYINKYNLNNEQISADFFLKIHNQALEENKVTLSAQKNTSSISISNTQKNVEQNSNID